MYLDSYMRTDSKQVRSAIREHILECVYDYNEKQFTTFEDAAKHLNNEFDRVANYPLNLQKFPNNQKRFMDYMQGLPFSFHFSYEDISNYLESLELNTSGKEFSCEKSETLYYYLIYSEMLKAVTK
jgi:hypothetical protein